MEKIVAKWKIQEDYVPKSNGLHKEQIGKSKEDYVPKSISLHEEQKGDLTIIPIRLSNEVRIMT